VAQILTVMLNDIHLHLLKSNFGLYFQAAFLLSPNGREEELKRISNSENKINSTNSMLNYSETNVVKLGMNNLISLENELLNQIEIDDDSSEYVLGERDDDFSNDVKVDNILLKTNENANTKEKVLEDNLFFFCYLIFLIFNRKQLCASVEDIYEDICSMNLRYCTVELLNVLWENYTQM
jgi:hypothetical protein